MINWIEIGGETRPARFGMSALYYYEMETGQSAVSAFAEMQGGSVSIVKLATLLYCGLKAGCLSEKRPVNFSLQDVAVWMDDTPDILQKVAEMITAAFPDPTSEEEKKPTPPPPTVKIAMAEA